MLAAICLAWPVTIAAVCSLFFSSLLTDHSLWPKIAERIPAALDVRGWGVNDWLANLVYAFCGTQLGQFITGMKSAGAVSSENIRRLSYVPFVLYSSMIVRLLCRSAMDIFEDISGDVRIQYHYFDSLHWWELGLSVVICYFYYVSYIGRRGGEAAQN
ncbi:hypothetical protein ACMAUO_06595 [Gluconacetobacter sp. Hr-1-5]|uniref:hypothetical protein n=1 Tax=Gluconacetobacter sp. Hr-1-5 TaxID=3395370 RepID=UPI003B517284